MHTYKPCCGMLRKYSNCRPAQATYQVQGQPGIHNRPYLKKKKKILKERGGGGRKEGRKGRKARKRNAIINIIYLYYLKMHK